jgi:queuosine precursor transporter
MQMKETEKNLFLVLSLIMGLVVILSNYLVQIPFEYFDLENILTYGAFSYPITFLITDLANRSFGKKIARKIVYIGFISGVLLTLFVSTNFEDIISIRIAVGSGLAFFIAQNLDVIVYDKNRKNSKWFVAPFLSSVIGSSVDTFLFFSIAFYNTGIPWVTLSLGDLTVKLLMALIMLVPFRILLTKIRIVYN